VVCVFTSKESTRTRVLQPYEHATVPKIQEEVSVELMLRFASPALAEAMCSWQVDFIVSFGSRSPSRARVSLLFPQECPPVVSPAWSTRTMCTAPHRRRVAHCMRCTPHD